MKVHIFLTIYMRLYVYKNVVTFHLSPPEKAMMYVHMCQENSQQFLFIPVSLSVCQNVRFFTHVHTK